MNKFFKTLSLAAVLAVLTALLGAGLVQALQGLAAPEPLPYGLSIQDKRADVERKLGQPKVTFAPEAGWEPGLPDEGGSPDRFHYWAIYRRFGLTVVYDSPFPGDQGATVHAIYVDE